LTTRYLLFVLALKEGENGHDFHHEREKAGPRTNRDCGWLWFGQAISSLGDSITIVYVGGSVLVVLSGLYPVATLRCVGMQ
jgi:hypothetical protein